LPWQHLENISMVATLLLLFHIFCSLSLFSPHFNLSLFLFSLHSFAPLKKNSSKKIGCIILVIVNSLSWKYISNVLFFIDTIFIKIVSWLHWNNLTNNCIVSSRLKLSKKFEHYWNLFLKLYCSWRRKKAGKVKGETICTNVFERQLDLLPKSWRKLFLHMHPHPLIHPPKYEIVSPLDRVLVFETQGSLWMFLPFLSILKRK